MSEHEPVYKYPLSKVSAFIKLSDQRVLQLVQQGIIPSGEKGKYDITITTQAYIEYLRGLAKGRDDSKVKHEKDKLKEETRLKRLAADKLEKSLVDTEGVKKAATDRSREYRDSMMNLPDRLSPLLSAEDNTDKIHKMISDEIRSILKGIKDDYWL